MKSGLRIAVVTASTAGIGFAIAQSLCKAGFHVVVSSRSAEHVAVAISKLQDMFGTGMASGVVCHVGKANDRARLLAHTLGLGGSVDALVLNAAASTAFGPLLETTEQQWDKMFEINVKSTFMTLREFAPVLGAGASVVLIASIASYNALPRLGAYSVTKTALLGLTKALAVELGVRGVRVNAVAPGIIRTAFSRLLWDKPRDGGRAPVQGALDGKGEGAQHMRIPLGRIGEPEDVGGVVAFLVSRDAAYITGETVVVAGGANSKL